LWLLWLPWHNDAMTPHSEPPICAFGLRRAFRQGDVEINAVDGVDFTASAGELVAIMGPSGSGKSTLLHLLGALDRPDAGRVLIDGCDISSLPERELAMVRRRRLGFLLQFFSLLSTMSALENVAFPLLLDGVRDPHHRAREVLEEVGLGHRLEHRPAQLSGGEQQRVALARALVARPAVVLADEPTGSLDSASSDEILELLGRAAQLGQTIVIATHDQAAASQADRVVHLVDGRLLGHPAGSLLERASLGREQTPISVNRC
jgi:putative ABC transport system ATP-binding protein